MESLYVAGDGWLHRRGAGAKLGTLAAAGIALFLVRDWRVMLVAALVSAALLVASGAGMRRIWRQSRTIVVLVAIVVAAAWYFEGGAHAATTGLRLAALVAAALAVTFTTRSADLLAACERALAPFERLGWVDAARVALALSLALRFMPEIRRRFAEIRDAQAARGIRAHPVRLVVPLVVAVLRSADAIAEAIDARGYPPERAPRRRGV